MRKIFKVNPRDRKIYLGKDMETEGYCSTGQLEGYPNAFTITLVKPGASLQQAITSLKTVNETWKRARKMGKAGKSLLPGSSLLNRIPFHQITSIATPRAQGEIR